MGKRIGNRRGRIIVFTLLFVILFSIIGCAPQSSIENTIYCFNDNYSSYAEVASQILPSYIVDKSNTPIPTLNEGALAVEAFNKQALPAMEFGVAGYWYPQYLATVIIAIDRDMTDTPVTGWSDLPAAGEIVGYAGLYTAEMIFAAIAYGLEGENFSLKSAAELLAGLRAKSLFIYNSYDQPITICYDYQAAAMIKEGRNLEVIVPREGTLTYERGLLSSEPLEFTNDVDSLLLTAGFRLPDGTCDSALYPVATDYENAHTVKDYDHLNRVCQDGLRILRRTVLLTRVYSSADGKEHLLFGLLYMILVVIWLSTVMRRAMQKSVRQATLLTAIILVGWMAVRMIKYQIEDPVLGRYLWYSYYLFQMLLPIIALYLAWSIDRQGDKSPPKWLQAAAAFNGALVILTLTNDLHNLVFKIDLSSPYWSDDYGYGFAFWLIQIACYLPLAAAIVIMLVKNVRNPHKKGLVFPIFFFALMALYGYGYIARVPIAWESDITMVTGLFTLLFFESAIRTGMIPVNTKYNAFFTHSTLAMQITDIAGKTILSSASDTKYDDSAITSALTSFPLPAQQNPNTLIYAHEIIGGTALWQEDITVLNKFHTEVEDSIRSLTIANSFLAGEEKIERAIADETEKARLMTELEIEISVHTARLSSMIEQLDNTAGQINEKVIISLLLCYIKRRSNLFFREREADTIPSDELVAYFDELIEIANYADIKIILNGEIKKSISVRIAKLFYQFFYNVIDWAVNGHWSKLIAYLNTGGGISMRLLPSGDARTFDPDPELITAITVEDGVIDFIEYDDVFGICLSFQDGGKNV